MHFIIRSIAIIGVVLLSPMAHADILYSVVFSTAEIDGKKFINIADIAVMPSDATKDSSIKEYDEMFKQAKPDRFALFKDKQAKLFASNAEAKAWRDDLIEKSKSVDYTVEYLGATPNPEPTPMSNAAWPFNTSDAKKRQFEAAKAYGELVETKAAGRDFIFIPPGEFIMGSPPGEVGRNDDELLHRVRISKPFYLAREDEALQDNTMMELQQWINQMQASAPDGYAFRLPTEAEWEYAARAGKDTAYHTGNELFGANYDDHKFKGKMGYINCAGQAVVPNHPVDENSPGRYQLKGTTLSIIGKGRITSYRGCNDNDKTYYHLKVTEMSLPDKARIFQPNAWGLYDMLGRYEEIVSDKYGTYASGAGVLVDPLQRAGEQQVVRGGNSTSPAVDVRLARRGKVKPDDLDVDPKFATIGVRLVLFKLSEIPTAAVP